MSDRLSFAKISADEYLILRSACHSIPPAKGNYLEPDFVSNLLLTVLDYQLKNVIVSRAYQHFKTTRWDRIRTLNDLKVFLARYPDNRAGNTQASQDLWGYKYWNRIEKLRRLVEFFESAGITNQRELRRWAVEGDFESTFKGRVKGLGFAVYKWLTMRVGVETIKPDVHILRFLEKTLGRRLGEQEAVGALESVAKDLGLKAYELDWAIWEYDRGEAGTR